MKLEPKLSDAQIEVKLKIQRQTPADNPLEMTGLLQSEARIALRMSEIVEELQNVNENVERVNSALSEFLFKSTESPRTEPQDVSALVASAITRFGVIVIIMFFAQSLISLYRYALRMSSSYKAKALTLVLAAGHEEKLEIFSKFSSTDHIGMGREAKSVSEEIAKLSDLIKAIKPV